MPWKAPPGRGRKVNALLCSEAPLSHGRCGGRWLFKNGCAMQVCCIKNTYVHMWKVVQRAVPQNAIFVFSGGSA